MDVDGSPNRKPDGHLMLDSVRSILFSGRPDDAISGELAELLGFDNLELASDILRNRDQFFEEQIIISPPSKSKGKPPGRSSLSAEGEFSQPSSQTRGALHLIKSGGAWKNSCKRMYPGRCSPVLQSVTVLSNVAHLVLS
jgi:hypothetical protein